MTGKGTDPFGKVAEAVAAGADKGQSGKAKGTKAEAGGEWVAPVPDDAPQPKRPSATMGQPGEVWTYRDADGRILSYVARFDKADGGKDLRPRTLWREGGKLVWRWKAPPLPRPLYRLDALAASPAAPVLLVEGEKTADAAARLFPAFVAMTWPGGSKAAGKADWKPLAGRRVMILPDADAPGVQAAAEVAEAARSAGAEGVAIVTLPDGLPIGWDCADRFPAALSREALAELLAGALAEASRGAVKLPYGFTLSRDGLFYKERKGDSEHDLRLADGFEVLGLARNSDGGDWAVLVRFRDLDGRRKELVIPRARLASEAAAVRAELAAEGLFISPSRGKADRFAAFLAEVGHSCRWTLAQRTGWVDGQRFALPGDVIASGDGEPVYFTGNGDALHYRQRGTIEGWQAGIASRAIGNRLLVFALGLAFVGPIMRALALEGGGFHFRGASSSGKTTLATSAGSVWGGGGPLGFASSWRATGNALEGVAFGHSETALILDELALVDPAEAGNAAYALATGQGKARAKQDGALRKRAEWRVMVLSTGEIGLADHMRSARLAQRTMAGQELRLIDLAADAGAGMGAFEQLHGAAGAAEFADAIKEAAAKDYGLAGPLFVRRMIARGQPSGARARELLADFVAEARRGGDSGQIHRAALRFGAVAAAGELATELGVLPWPAGTAKAAALWLFGRWAEGFGRTGLMEERQVIIAVRNAIQQNQARFGTVTARLADDEESGPSPRAGEARSLVTLGYSHAIDMEPVYLLHAAGWDEVLKGFDRKFAAKALADAGYLWADTGNRHKKKVRLAGNKPQPFYVIRASILEYDEEAGPEAEAEAEATSASRAEWPSGGWRGLDDWVPGDD